VSNRAYRQAFSQPDVLTVEIVVELSEKQLKEACIWASEHAGNPLAQELLAVWLKGAGFKMKPEGDNFRRANPSDAADAFASMFEHMARSRGDAYYSFKFDDVFGRGRASSPNGGRPVDPPSQGWRAILGVTGAGGREEISAAWKRLLMKNHQDSGLSAAAKEERAKTLNVAKQQAFREVLS
jgi:hypothetical protein